MARIPHLNHRGGWKEPVTLAGALAAAWLVLGASGLRAAGQSPDAGYVTVQDGKVTPHLEAYGQIEPGATLMLSFAESGVVAGLQAEAGTSVQAGEVLAHLSGPHVQSVLSQAQAEVRRARARLGLSKKSLAAQKRELALHRGTQEAVRQAQGAVTQAQRSLANAQSRLEAVRQMMILSSPVDGAVLMADAMNGEQVSAAQPILTLQTQYRLWLEADYYGSDLSTVRAGMTGTFTPADGSGSIPVQVCAVAGLLTAGGGASIVMVPAAPGSRWIDGEIGTVTLNLPQRVLIAVPTRSLILNQGRWWVLVHTPHGDRPRAVVPGPSRGWQTFLEDGLKPGEQVVVENAYLLFHRNISQRYQPPD